MATMTACRRRHRRHRIASEQRAHVELDFPSTSVEGNRCPLLDVSVAGVSFVLSDQLVGVEVGTDIRDVVIRIGDCVLHGDLMVMHVTPGRRVCGALFYPTTDTDLLKLKSLIAGLEAAQTD